MERQVNHKKTIRFNELDPYFPEKVFIQSSKSGKRTQREHFDGLEVCYVNPTMEAPVQPKLTCIAQTTN